MDPITLSAIVAGGSSVLNGLGNLFGQSKANQANERLLQKQMDYDYYKMQKQQQYQLDMYDIDRQWNDYSSQVQRLRNAGLNPALMFYQGSLGSSGSMPSAPSGGSPSPSNVVQPLNFDALGTGISNAVQQYYQLMNMDEQTKLVHEQMKTQKTVSLFKAVRELAEIGKIGSETSKNFADTAIKKLEKMFMNDTYQYRVEQERGKMGLTLAAETGEHLQNDYQTIQNDIQKELRDKGVAALSIRKMTMELMQAAADIADKNASAFMKRSAGKKMIAERAGQLIKNWTDKYDADNYPEYHSLIVRKLEEEVFKLHKENLPSADIGELLDFIENIVK